ncbi:uncharacterized protein N7483_010478 [Penicillium malachiteum]|uniref:uncharacterized protein n=1 Tax=Penicillium malachiteum TaxID=1324776 RepID=UPI0025490E50|nr:uncharacterized protein N7483_010478 [Penicillium malachiteum]KAJ5713297.1 hypothetical protein N7483_010478 [Penicillium malachiteum]
MAAKNAISVSQFAEHFRLAWSGVRGVVPHGHQGLIEDVAHLPRRVGLAVSGGADSMALAYLCRQLEKTPIGGPISVTAFVVDHHARAESSAEAKTVKSWLSALGIDTQILELDWSQISGSQDQSTQSNAALTMPTAFETHARRLRFQALGKACRKNDIQALLLGHHRDDSIETTIWRLATGARRAGLGGIQSIARIPECHGIFGVSESGKSLQFANSNNNNGKGKTNNSLYSSKESFATGGVFVCRPLLSCSKTRLLATCHENNIPYVSDPTNFDPTLTPRNAVRSLISSNSLPLALQGPRILELIRSSRDLLQVSSSLSDQLLSSRCRILNMNLRTGTLTIQVSEVPSWMDPLAAHNSLERVRQIQALSLRRITELVSPFPQNHFSLRSFEPFVSRIFGSTDQIPHENLNAPRSFTLGGVMFSYVASDDNQTKSGGKSTWRLARQPFMKNRAPTTSFELPFPTEKMTSSRKPSYTHWALWDDRYWIRFSLVLNNKQQKNRSTLPEGGSLGSGLALQIRSLQQSDFQELNKDKVTAIRLANLRKLLSTEAPGPARFTIPVLTNAGLIGKPLEKGNLLALPTLDCPLHGPHLKDTNTMEIVVGGTSWVLRWAWMFKMIDTDALRLMGRPVEA